MATQFLKIKDQYKCLVELIETAKSASTLSKKQCKLFENLSSREDTLSIKRYIQKYIQNNDISRIMNIEKTRHFTDCLHFTSTFSVDYCFSRKKFFHAAKTVSKGMKHQNPKYKAVHNYKF